MYEKGWGVPQNLQRAKQLYARAAGSSNTAVANLGKQYFSNVPDSAPAGRTPERTALGSSDESKKFWSVVIVGALGIAALALLTSGGSAGTSNSGGYTNNTYTPPVSSPTTSSPVAPPVSRPLPPHPCFGNIGKTLDGAAGLGFDNVCR
jgi:TPR repeat protein